MERTIRLYTGAGGMDLFEECMEADFGAKRIYFGSKIPRIIRKIKGIRIRESHTGRYFRKFMPKQLSL